LKPTQPLCDSRLSGATDSESDGDLPSIDSSPPASPPPNTSRDKETPEVLTIDSPTPPRRQQKAKNKTLSAFPTPKKKSLKPTQPLCDSRLSGATDSESDGDLPSIDSSPPASPPPNTSRDKETPEVVTIGSPTPPRRQQKAKSKTLPAIPTPKKKSLKPTQPLCDSRLSGAKHKTFLESLSLAKHGEEEIDFSRCHPEATKYIKHFSRHKVDLCKQLYNLYNKEAFDNRLPSEMEMIWCPRLTKTAGTCMMKGKMDKQRKTFTERSCKIKLSAKVLDSADRLRDTLVHEMCHAAAWLLSEVQGGHGPIWKSWAGRCMKRLPELPIISRCHAYEIRTKFTYQCTGLGCGATYGRHSKSIDVEKKVCGKCRGRLVLLSNSTKSSLRHSKEGATGDQTPRTPNAFAMFVKEKYKTCRTPGVSHADAMKQISAMFAQTKISK